MPYNSYMRVNSTTANSMLQLRQHSQCDKQASSIESSVVCINSVRSLWAGTRYMETKNEYTKRG